MNSVRRFKRHSALFLFFFLCKREQKSRQQTKRDGRIINSFRFVLRIEKKCLLYDPFCFLFQSRARDSISHYVRRSIGRSGITISDLICFKPSAQRHAMDAVEYTALFEEKGRKAQLSHFFPLTRVRIKLIFTNL